MRDIDYTNVPVHPVERVIFERELREFEKQASRYVPGSTARVFKKENPK